MGIRFATNSTTRLPLSDNEFIDVKTRLSHGEQEEMFARMAPNMTPGEPTQLDRREVRTAKALAYLVGWSAVGPEGNPEPYSPLMSDEDRAAILRNLESDSFEEIYRAVVDHEERQDHAVAALKKTSATPLSLVATSPLPSDAVGASSGSAA